MSFWTDLNDRLFQKDDLSQSIVAQNQAVSDYVGNLGNNNQQETQSDNTLLYGALGVSCIIAIGTIIYFAKK